MSIGVAIVCYNTPELISKAVNSVFPYVTKVIIVDNSEQDSECYRECERLSKIDNVFVIHTGENIGHGIGLNLAIKNLDTEYIICMDSDCVLLDSTLITDMQNALSEKNVYGSGRVTKLSSKLQYLYLPFCMFKKCVFEAHSPFIHHGAPFVRTMKEIRHKGLKLIQVQDYQSRIHHEGKATRKIAGWWRKGFGGKKGI